MLIVTMVVVKYDKVIIVVGDCGGADAGEYGATERNFAMVSFRISTLVASRSTSSWWV